MLSIFRQTAESVNKPTVVTFTGGMGAQIISAAVYFSKKKTGSPVFADFSYFDKPKSVAVAGKAGDCSHWPWQLEQFGLFPSSFDVSPGFTKGNAEILQDGPKKLGLGLKALEQPDIQQRFKVPLDVSDILPFEFAGGYICIHVRRGDYVNVASHLVSDDEFISLAKKFAGLVDNIVVLSDSPIGPVFQKEVSSCFKIASFQDNIDAYTAHRIMRNARILICSNSQFSLIAAAINPKVLAFIPKQWFGEGDRHIEEPIHSRCLFQIMGNGI